MFRLSGSRKKDGKCEDCRAQHEKSLQSDAWPQAFRRFYQSDSKPTGQAEIRLTRRKSRHTGPVGNRTLRYCFGRDDSTDPPPISEAEVGTAKRTLRTKVLRTMKAPAARRGRNADRYIHHRAASGRLEQECDTASVGHLAYRSPRPLSSFWRGRFGWENRPLRGMLPQSAPSNRAHGAAGQNRSCSMKWAAKVEKFRPRERFFFLTFPFHNKPGLSKPECPNGPSGSE